jgi:hypothetical protein
MQATRRRSLFIIFGRTFGVIRIIFLWKRPASDSLLKRNFPLNVTPPGFQRMKRSMTGTIRTTAIMKRKKSGQIGNIRKYIFMKITFFKYILTSEITQIV